MTQALETERKLVLLEKRPNGLSIITFDSGQKENFLSTTVLRQLEATLNEIERDPNVKAIGIVSARDNNFVSGADLHEVLKMSYDEVYQLARRSQDLLTRIANLPIPTVCGIHGTCLGGGLELALSAARRIATAAPETVIGLPEIKLGLLPGLGGTQRLPRLIDLKAACEFILFAQSVDAKKAHELGIIDEIVDKDNLMSRLESYCLELAADPDWKSRPHGAVMDAPEKQEKYFKMMERTLRIKTKGNYPAPVKALESIRTGLSQGMDKGYEFEARAFADLIFSDSARNLIFLFFTSEFYKMSAAAKAAKQGTNLIKSVGIIGGGIMGTNIASWAAIRGFDVTIKAASDARQELMLETVENNVSRSARAAENEGTTQTTSAIKSAKSFADMADVDILIEACAEDFDTKVDILSKVLPLLKPTAIVATNTSSLSVNALVEKVGIKQECFGIHFFHPVDRMPLVEVIPAKNTGKESQSKVLAFLSALDKLPLQIKDSTCFLVNRILCCYINEAARLVDQGVAVNWIEDAAIDFGMPLGPWGVTDEVGMDVALLVADSLQANIGERFTKPAVLKGVKDIGIIGKRHGKGIYNWDQSGKNLGLDPDLSNILKLNVSAEKAPPEECKKLAEHIILPMIDEAARCLDEKVVRRPREIDVATVMGMGFPPFRGGLLRYADSLGIPYIIEKLEKIYSEPGPKREVSSYLRQMSESGRNFYSSGKDAGDN
jgi:3-hydroxyacyl-CoA dehydrogenase/enoyl-CoA hydratase/3-hydroxybutyryl-CoA epimerase